MLTHAELVSIAWRWLTTRGGCAFAYTEFGTSSTLEMPDALGFLDMEYTVLIEVKVSRADFLADVKKPWRVKPETGMGDFRYYMAPRGLLGVDEIPRHWGLLEVGKSAQVKLTRPLTIHERSGRNQAATLAYQVEQIRSGAWADWAGKGDFERQTLERWERLCAERWPKDAHAELALLYATARRLHVKGAWGILKTPLEARIDWKVSD